MSYNICFESTAYNLERNGTCNQSVFTEANGSSVSSVVLWNYRT